MSSFFSPLKPRTQRHQNNEDAYTLIELIAVVVLLALLSTFFVSRFTFNSSWTVDSSLRELRSKLEFTMQDAFSRQTSYQIELDLNQQSYRVWEILPLDPSEFVQVDTLSGLRSQKEQARRNQQEENQAQLNLEEEYNRASLRDGRPLDELFYQMVFDDPSAPSRRVPPLEYPSLAEPVFLPPEVRIVNVRLDNHEAPQELSNTIVINFTPTLLYSFIEVLLETEKGPVSIEILPFENSTMIRSAYE